jgi:hypothetical protein
MAIIAKWMDTMNDLLSIAGSRIGILNKELTVGYDSDK